MDFADSSHTLETKRTEELRRLVWPLLFYVPYHGDGHTVF